MAAGKQENYKETKKYKETKERNINQGRTASKRKFSLACQENCITQMLPIAKKLCEKIKWRWAWVWAWQPKSAKEKVIKCKHEKKIANEMLRVL